MDAEDLANSSAESGSDSEGEQSGSDDEAVQFTPSLESLPEVEAPVIMSVKRMHQYIRHGLALQKAKGVSHLLAEVVIGDER